MEPEESRIIIVLSTCSGRTRPDSSLMPGQSMLRAHSSTAGSVPIPISTAVGMKSRSGSWYQSGPSGGPGRRPGGRRGGLGERPVLGERAAAGRRERADHGECEDEASTGAHGRGR
ncbi:MAG: hypothetical protein WKF31_03735 [Thermoleophilaceae bacterium]